MRFLRLGLVCCALLAAAGCGGLRVPLPAVEIDIGPSEVVEFGPAPGVPGGSPLNAARLELEANCCCPRRRNARCSSMVGPLAMTHRLRGHDRDG